MWRLNLYTRYIEKDNGVYVEIELVALSRSVPWMFALLVNPYLSSIPRDYLTNYIHTTQKALSANDSEPGRRYQSSQTLQRK